MGFHSILYPLSNQADLNAITALIESEPSRSCPTIFKDDYLLFAEERDQEYD
jgi:hypothetical protein